MTGIFTASSVLTASALNTAINSLTLNAQTGTTYTFVLADAGKLVTASNASAQTYTIPLNSSVAYAVGTRIEVLNISTGTVTLSPTGGVTLNGTTTVGAGQRVQLTKTATDTWYASPVGGGGLTFITSATASAASTLSVNNCFTSAYANYLLLMEFTASANVATELRMRASAADDSSANYYFQYVESTTTTVTGSGGSGATSMQVGKHSTGRNFITVTVATPAVAQTTSILSDCASSENTGRYFRKTVGQHSVATAYDGFTLFPTSGTITGTVRVYGYQNA